MIFRQLFDPDSSTYTYLLADPVTKEAALIDPVLEQVDAHSVLLRELGLTLKYTLETHVHADHITGAAALRERLGSQTVTHRNSGAMCTDVPVQEGSRLTVGNIAIDVLETPGHTDADVSYLVEARAFTGDALFIGGTGRTDFQSGDSARLYDSITRKLFALPPDTLVYPGHDYNGRTVSTIRQEMATNPRVGGGKSRDAFMAIMGALNLPYPRRIDQALPANRRCGQPGAVAG